MKLKLSGSQSLVFGLLLYILIGFILISLPFSQQSTVNPLDNLFTVVSAISTTGLTTVSVVDSYTFFGQFILVMLFQVGGWGFMTVTSFFFIVLRKEMSERRIMILNTSYSLPANFDLKKFIRNTVVFTLIIEAIGTLFLYIFINPVKPDNALWSAFFHTVSAFATAGFSIYNNSFMDFSINKPVNIVLSILCYLGAIGFIVLQDLYYGVKNKKKITFTSKVILTLTGILLIVGTIVFFFVEPSIQDSSFFDRLTVSFFQTMTASTTAGFNTIDIGLISRGALFIIVILMIIGASPSGTGGGIKTTSISALIGVVSSLLKKRETISLLGNQIPFYRIVNAISVTIVYIFTLSVGILLLLIFDNHSFEKTFFEVASALGTVGLSTGITGSLNIIGKIIIIIFMYFGRVGPLTIGLALFSSNDNRQKTKEDLAI